MDDFYVVIQKELIPYYYKEIDEKFTLLTDKFNVQLKKAGQKKFKLKLKMIEEFIQNKKKLKLPWDIDTVKNSISATLKQFK